MNKHVNIVPKVLGFVTIAFLAGAILVFGDWTPPLHSPPRCDTGNPGCDIPLNTSLLSQIKLGGLVLGAGFPANLTALKVPTAKMFFGSGSPDTRSDVRLDVNNSIIANVNTPVNPKDAVNKEYVDAQSGGSRPRYSEKCDDWSSQKWSDQEECLKDGRWHHVYSNSSGGTGVYGGLSNLRSRIQKGVEVKVVNSTGFISSCTDLALGTSVVICTSPMHWGSWNAQASSAGQVHIASISYYTDGRIEYLYSSDIATGGAASTDVRWGKQKVGTADMDWWIKY